MGLTFNGASVEISGGTVNVGKAGIYPSLPDGATPVTINLWGVTYVAGTDVFTPTAGKKFYLLGYSLHTTSQNALDLRDNSTTKIFAMSMNAAVTPNTCNLNMPIIFETKLNIRGISGLSTTAYGSFWGYEL